MQLVVHGCSNGSRRQPCMVAAAAAAPAAALPALRRWCLVMPMSSPGMQHTGRQLRSGCQLVRTQYAADAQHACPAAGSSQQSAHPPVVRPSFHSSTLFSISVLTSVISSLMWWLLPLLVLLLSAVMLLSAVLLSGMVLLGLRPVLLLLLLLTFGDTSVVDDCVVLTSEPTGASVRRLRRAAPTWQVHIVVTCATSIVHPLPEGTIANHRRSQHQMHILNMLKALYMY